MGDAIYNHGYSMMDDLVGYKSFYQVLLLNITGRMPDKRLADWIEASCICLSWPDPRIWCNKIGTFAGSMRCSPVVGVSMGILASDSRMYAAGAVKPGASFIVQALKKNKNGRSVLDIIEDELQHKTAIMGFKRPLATGDERIPPLERTSKALGFGIGEHLELAYEIDNKLQHHYKESMNVLGYCVAFLSDQGLTPDEIARTYSTWVHSGVHACYAEAYDNPPESFLPLRCNDIDYQGKPMRQIP